MTEEWDQSVLAVSPGDAIPTISISMTLQRLVMEAGANRDFSLMHHDRAVAQSAGAPDAFANTFFLMGMFERLVREWVGPTARINKIGPLKMLNFNTIGNVLTFAGRVDTVEKDRIALGLWCESGREVTTTCSMEINL
jgi:hypothetical protein